MASSSVSTSAAAPPEAPPPSPSRSSCRNAVRARRTSDVQAASEHILAGGLVAFPTETVYGLGCNALCGRAIRAVFDAKERPLTDPLIVHVPDAREAYPLWQATAQKSNRGVPPRMRSENYEDTGDSSPFLPTPLAQQSRILKRLCEHFWPGPLTLVAPAAPVPEDSDAGSSCDDSVTDDDRDSSEEWTYVLPDIVMAGTGYVAVRCPAHGRAQALLRFARVPLVAPSANKFGHVSPTTADHVWDDLKHEDIWILEDADVNDDSDDDNGAPIENGYGGRVGVESTVVKVEIMDDRHMLTVLRQGAVSARELEECLDGLLPAAAAVHPIVVRSQLKQVTADHVAAVAPGQTLRHYSPNVPSFLVSEECHRRHLPPSSTAEASETMAIAAAALRDAVVLDFAGQLGSWRDTALAYRDLSASGNPAQAAQRVFEALRWAESVPRAQSILFPDNLITASSGDGDDFGGSSKEYALLLAVKDRLTRAASGVVIDSLQEIPASASNANINES
jgi:L-threonylcarbamoyladenylate synthase